MKITTKKLILSSTIASLIASAGTTSDELTPIDQINLAYSGDQSRIGVGITEEGKFVGDYLYSFNNTYHTNWMTQAWYSNGAGGVELDYHWISGVDSEQDLVVDGASFHVSKLFFALDQNTFDDRKLTIGGGRESEDKFWNVYTSMALTGRRLISNTSIFTNDIINGFLGNHATTQTRTIEDITRIYEHPYDWGVGARFGKYFNSSLVRLTAGLDYESGDFSSDQLTASVDLEKYFANTGHSIALHVEQIQKGGDFVVDKNDTRASLLYRYDFGRTYQPTERYQEVKVVDEEALARLREERKTVVQNKIDLSSMAFFNLDSATLRDDTISVLKDVVDKIKSHELGSKINIVGHTCSIGKSDYNQGLSERRANAAKAFFVSQGISVDTVNAIGKGETEPAFDNNGPDIAKNRRVAISFLTIEKDFKQAEISPDEVPVKWVKQQIKTPPSWLARALHNPAKHKKTVDVYQYHETESKTTLGDVVVLNELPIAIDDAVSVLRNSTGLLIDVLANDSDPEDDTLSVVDTTQPSHGSVVNNGTSVTYTPNAGYIGTDTFDYTIDDGNGDQATATVTITVQNNAPSAQADEITVFRNSIGNAIQVLTNDSDAENETIIVVDATDPSHGTVTFDGTTILYTPQEGFIGTDTFEYTIEDESGDRTTAIVTVRVVNNAPSAIDDIATVFINSSNNLIDVLSNDTDIDSVEGLVINAVTQPANGTVTFTGASVTYTPNPGFIGTDVFTYTVEDENGEMVTAQVTVSVVDNSIAAADDEITVLRNSDLTSIDVLSNDTGENLVITGVTGASNGTVTTDGSTISYQPNQGFIGVDTVVYTIENANGTTSTATLTINVINNGPVAIDDTATVTSGLSVDVDVLSNDSDVDGTNLSILSVGTAQHGTVTINDDGTLTYQSTAGYVGTDSFTYTNIDEDGAEASATVIITVIASDNELPIAIDDAYNVDFNGDIDFNPLNNDSDPDGDALTVESVDTSSLAGTLTVNSDGSMHYQAPASFSGSDSFTYTITDGNGGFATATVTFTVSSTSNTAPIAVDDLYLVDYNGTYQFNPLENDSDPDGDTLSLESVDTSGLLGSLTINADGTLLYIAPVSFSGNDVFTYTISDGNGGFATATVTMCVND